MIDSKPLFSPTNNPKLIHTHINSSECLQDCGASTVALAVRTRVDTVAVRVPSLCHELHVTQRLRRGKAWIARRRLVEGSLPLRLERRRIQLHVVRSACLPPVGILDHAGLLLADRRELHDGHCAVGAAERYRLRHLHVLVERQLHHSVDRDELRSVRREEALEDQRDR